MIRGLALVVAVLASGGLLGCDGGTALPPDGGAGEGGSPGDAGGSDGATAYELEAYCPGAPGCASAGDGVLRVGAARAEITAIVDERTDIQTVDVDMDGEFDPDVDDYADRDGVPGFQGVWMAGFGNARSARSIHDPQWARAVAVQSGDTTVVLVALDCVGYFIDEMDLVRASVADLDVDFVSISATHVHEARDTIGLWGIDTSTTGIDPEYMRTLRAQAARAIRDAVADLRPANVEYAQVRLRDVVDDITTLVSDVRDPVILDDEIRLLRFLRAGTDESIATLVNFASHPEYLDDRNTALSSDFPAWLRDGIEQGVTGPDGARVPGLGGLAVFFNGALGSQVGPGAIHPRRWDGTPIESSARLETTEVVGSQLAYHCLRALAPGGGSVRDETAAVGFRRRRFFVDVQNRGYHAGLIAGIFQRATFHFDPMRPISAANEPDVLTEVSVVDIGRARMIGAPGELDPALFVGGYDGSFTPLGTPIVDPSNPRPPQLERAPAPPYLQQSARDGGFEYVWLLGLTNDYLGYFIPAFDYVLDVGSPYLEEASGDHYEETNSVGIDGWPRIELEMRSLLAWSPDT